MLFVQQCAWINQATIACSNACRVYALQFGVGGCGTTSDCESIVHIGIGNTALSPDVYSVSWLAASGRPVMHVTRHLGQVLYVYIALLLGCTVFAIDDSQ